MFVWKVWRAFEAVIWEGDFSGWRMPGTVKARWRVCVDFGKAVEQCAEADFMEDSSGGLSDYLV